MWAQRPPRSEAHRSYIYIDEEDIVEGYELPVFRIEALRSGTRRSLQTMVDGDPAAERRLADLAPALARETEVHAREEAVFFAERPGVARDVPSTPDVVGPFRSWLRQRR